MKQWLHEVARNEAEKRKLREVEDTSTVNSGAVELNDTKEEGNPAAKHPGESKQELAMEVMD